LCIFSQFDTTTSNKIAQDNDNFKVLNLIAAIAAVGSLHIIIKKFVGSHHKYMLLLLLVKISCIRAEEKDDREDK